MGWAGREHVAHRKLSGLGETFWVAHNQGMMKGTNRSEESCSGGLAISRQIMPAIVGFGIGGLVPIMLILLLTILNIRASLEFVGWTGILLGQVLLMWLGCRHVVRKKLVSGWIRTRPTSLVMRELFCGLVLELTVFLIAVLTSILGPIVGAPVAILYSMAVGRAAGNSLAERVTIERQPMPTCPACGYLLYYARDHRCPECGRRFQPEEFDCDNLIVGVDGILRPRRTEED